MRDRRGTTLIELLIVVMIVGILANIGLPVLRDMMARADATHIIGDYAAIRLAVFDYAAEGNLYPRSRGWNRVPPELVDHLPEGFTFDHAGATYRWRRWDVRRTRPGRQPRPVLGLQVRTNNRALLEALQSQFKGRITQVTRRRLTMVIE